MTDQEARQEIQYFIDDIWRWYNAKDLKSAIIIARGLVKLLIDIKKGL